MKVKLLMTWDIAPGREQDYFEFVVRDWVPGMQRLGLQPTDAWLTYYGEAPQILAAAETRDMTKMQNVLSSDAWYELTQQLLDFVHDFEYKVVQSKDGFQL